MPLVLVLAMTTILASPTLTLPEHILTTTPQDVWLDALHDCENPDNLDRWMDTNGKYTYGPYAFQMGTWLAFGKKFGATRDNIGSSTLQRTVARDMLDHGGQGHWYWCSKKLGDYPLTETESVR